MLRFGAASKLVRRTVFLACITAVGISAAVFVFIVKPAFDSPGVTAESPAYVALGDSVAAGIGLATYADSSACGRTQESYPAVLAESMGYRVTNLACSGATVRAGIGGQQTVNNLAVSAQLDALFATPETPDVVTLTIGANDINWTQFLACYASQCPADLTTQLTPGLQQLDANLSSVLNAMSKKYGSKAPNVIVTGYYSLFPQAVASACADTDGLDNGELQAINGLFSALNTRLRETTAAHPFATFAPIDFAGHELCSGDPWIQGVVDEVPFHPNEAGQQAIANQLSGVVKLK